MRGDPFGLGRGVPLEARDQFGEAGLGVQRPVVGLRGAQAQVGGDRQDVRRQAGLGQVLTVALRGTAPVRGQVDLGQDHQHLRAGAAGADEEVQLGTGDLAAGVGHHEYGVGPVQPGFGVPRLGGAVQRRHVHQDQARAQQGTGQADLQVRGAPDRPAQREGPDLVDRYRGPVRPAAHQDRGRLLGVLHHRRYRRAGLVADHARGRVDDRVDELALALLAGTHDEHPQPRIEQPGAPVFQEPDEVTPAAGGAGVDRLVQYVEPGRCHQRCSCRGRGEVVRVPDPSGYPHHGLSPARAGGRRPGGRRRWRAPTRRRPPTRRSPRPGAAGPNRTAPRSPRAGSRRGRRRVPHPR